MAVREQGRPDGQGARDAGAAAGSRHPGRLHPKQDIFAAGYSDGTILMVRINDGAEILVHRNAGEPVSALAWNAAGTMLAFAAEDGDAGLLEL